MSKTAELAERREGRYGMDQKAAICVVCAAASFMSGIDSTIVNVTVPTLGREFHGLGRVRGGWQPWVS